MNLITGTDSSGNEVTIQIRTHSHTPGGVLLQFLELSREVRLDIVTLAGLLDVFPPRLIRLGAVEILPEDDDATFFVDVHAVRVNLERLVASSVELIQSATPGEAFKRSLH